MNETQAADDMPHRSKAEIEAALAAAKADGARETMDRLTAAIGSDDVRRDPRRLAAAVDLLIRAPEMTGPDIAAFVIENIAATPPQDAATHDYAAARRAAMSVVWSNPARASGGDDQPAPTEPGDGHAGSATPPSR